MADVAYGTLPFREQIEFLRRKLNVTTESWTDVWQDAHDHAFMVAGANRTSLVEDFHEAVMRSVDQGETLADFRKRFDAIVAKHGWNYKGGRNWRSRVIYETNLRTSYAAGRYAQLQSLKKVRPYWLYIHADGELHPRPLHKHWGDMRLTLSADDPWWHMHYPPNGWGCKCSVRALNARDLKRMGIEPHKAPDVHMQEHIVGQHSSDGPHTVESPEGVDPGFAYAPGRRAWEDALAPNPEPMPPPPTTAQVTANRPPIPHPHMVDASRLLPADVSVSDAIDAFLAEFDATVDAPTIYTDVTDSPVLISDAFFRTRSGQLKSRLAERLRDMLLLADTIREPDEVWLAWTPFQVAKTNATFWQLRRRYLRWVQIDGEDHPGLVVYELGRTGWSGTSAFRPERVAYLERQRNGQLLYRRPKN